MTNFEGQILVVAKYDNVHGPLDVWGSRRTCSPFGQLQPENPKRSFVTVFEGQILVVAKYDNVHGPLDVGALAGHVQRSSRGRSGGSKRSLKSN